jgi:hypothetical protein
VVAEVVGEVALVPDDSRRAIHAMNVSPD